MWYYMNKYSSNNNCKKEPTYVPVKNQQSYSFSDIYFIKYLNNFRSTRIRTHTYTYIDKN